MNKSSEKSGTSVLSRRWKARLLALAGAATLVVSASSISPAWALAISQAYIFSDWSSPTNVSSAPFTLNATAGYQLTLNGSGVATSASALSGPTSVQITDRLYYENHTGTINQGENLGGLSMEDRVNNEIRYVDDSGLIQEGVTDAALNIDFSSGAMVTLRTSSTNVSVPGLVLFEDAGLDPFSLRYCNEGTCDLLFNGFTSGFTSSTRSTLLASGSGFGADDYAPGIDQAFWFIFDGPVTGGYFKIGDTSNYDGTRLEVDYVGVTGAPTNRVPEPSTLLLLGSGLVGLPLLRKLRSK
jgi:hypothetical protein